MGAFFVFFLPFRSSTVHWQQFPTPSLKRPELTFSQSEHFPARHRRSSRGRLLHRLGSASSLPTSCAFRRKVCRFLHVPSLPRFRHLVGPPE